MVHTFHKWILQAHMLRVEDALVKAFRDLSIGIGEGCFKGSSGRLRRAIDEFSSRDHEGRIIVEGSAVTSTPQTARLIEPGGPEHLHALWSSLSTAEKDALYRADPFIGNRNGIPHTDRDHYNRQTLTMLEERAAAADDTEAVKFYGQIEKALESPDESPRRYLSLLDDEFHTAISIGNPDTAENVVTFAAPAGRKTNMIPWLPDTSEKIRQAALSADPNAATSVIAWSGYDIPFAGRIVDAGYAQKGAPLLRDFQEGLRITHQGSQSNNTVIGFSYASVLTGHAAEQPLHADNIVFAGSFGVGAQRAADLRLVGVDPADIDRHVFSTSAKHDSFRLMPKTHGTPPTSPGFGSTVFSTDSTRGPWTSLGWKPSDHQSYWDSNNQALRNMGLIITGNGRLVT
ncbi:hypothetical protein B0T44_12645 [Nocardia donostiensis]|uniref:DUF1023 domain-containing protein n=2 Tax=Nocardia donostiensis TaxID=1538463 RepID=A0A1V2TJR8_9NOCA|nr:hypothetical protein B0T46_04975 [Nocardia donostiensis]OQS15348.1 hypothetical protein B0T36_08595 [Nocardia donostiensis]OQS19860.1 hypothetical protein B0T44_12645 [Nocardia donostiensis]